MKRIFFYLIFLMTNLSIVYSQNISGRIVSADKAPIPFANIVLNNVSDSSYVAGVVSNQEGYFNIPLKKDISYYLTVSFVGYVSVNLSCKQNDKFTVVLKEDAQMLKEVTVKAHLPKTQMKGDVLVTQVANSALAKLGTAKNVLSKIPGVVEQRGKIEVFGKGAPVFYINGRKVSNDEELNRLNADNIKNVEVISNPGARYGANVNAVIRIVTKTTDEGFGIHLRSDNTLAHYYTGSHQLDAHLKKGNLELFGTLGLDEGKSRSTINFVQNTHVDNLWTLGNTYKSVTKSNAYMGKMGFSFTPNEKHSLGATFQSDHSKDRESSTNQSTVYEDGSLYDKWQSEGKGTEKKNPRYEANAYYNGKIGNLGIDFNADYLFSKSGNDQQQEEISQNYEDRIITTYYQNKNKLYAEKLVFSYPLWTGDFSIGEESSHTERNNSFLNTENVLAEGNNSVKENNIAAFMEQTLLFGKTRLQLGLRYEHINADYRMESGGTNQKKKYDNLFPSFSLSAPIGKVKLSLSYNSKTTRPDYSQLDGNVSYINRFHYLKGNPLLQPVNRLILSASLSYKWCFFMANYTHSKNEIVYNSKSMEDDPKISLVSYDNYDKLDKLTLYCSLSPSIGFWSPTINVGYIQQWFETAFLDGTKSFNKPIVLTQFNNVFELPSDYTIRLDGSYQGHGHNQNMLLNDQFKFDFSVSKSFLHDKFNVRIDCNDVLGTYKFKPNLYNTKMIINQENINDTRSYSISLTYKLNSTKNKYKGTGAGNSEKNRL